MEIIFRTKEESNRIQNESFLKLTPVERVLAFFQMQVFFKTFPTTTKKENSNFIIFIENDKPRLG
jgi:hypothetical protein